MKRSRDQYEGGDEAAGGNDMDSEEELEEGEEREWPPLPPKKVMRNGPPPLPPQQQERKRGLGIQRLRSRAAAANGAKGKKEMKRGVYLFNRSHGRNSFVSLFIFIRCSVALICLDLHNSQTISSLYVQLCNMSVCM